MTLPTSILCSKDPSLACRSNLSFAGGVKEVLSQSLSACLTALIFPVYTKDGEPLIDLFHSSGVISTALGFCSQRGENLKGIGPRSWERQKKREMGSCSKTLEGLKLEEMTWLKRSLWRRNRSSLGPIWPRLNLWLIQVNLPLRGLASTRSPSEIRSSMFSWYRCLAILPLLFSLLDITTLKTPAITVFGKFCIPAENANIPLSPYIIWACIHLKYEIWYASLDVWDMLKVNTEYGAFIPGLAPSYPKVYKSCMKLL